MTSAIDGGGQASLEASAGLVTLAIDTSSAISSVSVARAGRESASMTLMEVRQHSQIVFEHLEMLLSLARLSIDDVDIFAAVTGPGSFTGLRIGLSAIEGIAAALRKPVIGVTTFDASARTAAASGPVMTLIDAGRGEVFAGIRRLGDEIFPNLVGKDCVGTLEKVIEEARAAVPDTEGVYIVGSGATRYCDEIIVAANRQGLAITRSSHLERDPSRWSVNPRPQALAAAAAEMAAAMYLSGRAGMQQGLHPYYLKPSDAEAKWKSPGTPA